MKAVMLVSTYAHLENIFWFLNMKMYRLINAILQDIMSELNVMVYFKFSSLSTKCYQLVSIKNELFENLKQCCHVTMVMHD